MRVPPPENAHAVVRNITATVVWGPSLRQTKGLRAESCEAFGSRRFFSQLKLQRLRSGLQTIAPLECLDQHVHLTTRRPLQKCKAWWSNGVWINRVLPANPCKGGDKSGRGINLQ